MAISELRSFISSRFILGSSAAVAFSSALACGSDPNTNTGYATNAASTTGTATSTSTVGGATDTTGTTGSTNTATSGGVTTTASTGSVTTATVTTGTTTTGGTTGGVTTGSCDGESVTVNRQPFGCDFAWGRPDDPDSSLDFVSTWVGWEEGGGINTYCGACDGLVSDVGQSGPTVVYYAYFIGYQANLMGGYGDCNVDMDDETLCTRGAQWIRDNRGLVVEMYANYARMTNQASPNKAVIWWLEGDFVQYSYADQSNPLSMQELGDLARDITCAIKSNQPNAIVAMNHSPWISNEESEAFWSAMPMDVIDLIWVQGPGDSGDFVNAGEYNADTANYAWLHQKTGASIMAETSWAGQAEDDRWSTASASAINQRISEGVVGVLVNNPGGDYTGAVDGLRSQISSVCQ